MRQLYKLIAYREQLHGTRCTVEATAPMPDCHILGSSLLKSGYKEYSIINSDDTTIYSTKENIYTLSVIQRQGDTPYIVYKGSLTDCMIEGETFMTQNIYDCQISDHYGNILLSSNLYA